MISLDKLQELSCGKMYIFREMEYNTNKEGDEWFVPKPCIDCKKPTCGLVFIGRESMNDKDFDRIKRFLLTQKKSKGSMKLDNFMGVKQ